MAGGVAERLYLFALAEFNLKITLHFYCFALTLLPLSSSDLKSYNTVVSLHGYTVSEIPRVEGGECISTESCVILLTAERKLPLSCPRVVLV